MNKTMKSRIETIKQRIEDSIKELIQFEREYLPEYSQNNLLMMLNTLERDLYTLEILHNNRYEAHSFLNTTLDFVTGEELKYKKLVQFIKDRVSENTHLFMFLSFYFDIDIY